MHNSTNSINFATPRQRRDGLCRTLWMAQQPMFNHLSNIGEYYNDDELKIAGTIDMIHKRGDVFDIYDWKRSHRIVDFWGKPIAVNNYGEKGLGELNQIEDTPYWHYCIQQNLYRYILERNYDIIIEKMYLVVFCDDTNEYRKLEVPRMDEVIISIVKSCKNGTVKKRLITLQGENLS